MKWGKQFSRFPYQIWKHIQYLTFHNLSCSSRFSLSTKWRHQSRNKQRFLLRCIAKAGVAINGSLDQYDLRECFFENGIKINEKKNLKFTHVGILTLVQERLVTLVFGGHRIDNISLSHSQYSSLGKKIRKH